MGVLTTAGITILLVIRVSTPAGTPTTAAVPTSNEVEIVHTTLHDIDDRCRTRSQPATPAVLQDDAARIVNFAGRYPNGSFAIDDETGTTLALLLVARQAFGTCAPAAASAVNAALPARYRDSPASTIPPT